MLGLSSAIDRLRTRFKRAAADMRQVERQKLMFNPDKVVPYLSALDVFHKWPETSSILHRAFDKAKYNAVSVDMRRVQRGQTMTLSVQNGLLPDELIEEIDAVLWNIERRLILAGAPQDRLEGPRIGRVCLHDSDQFTAFRLVGDIVAAHEEAMGSPGFQWETLRTAWAGDGHKAVDFWRELNAMRDWTALFDDDAGNWPRRRGRRRPALPPGVHVWAPGLSAPR